jgi:hypothetical protein
MGTGKKEAKRKERQGKDNDGMANVKVKVRRPENEQQLKFCADQSHRAKTSTEMPKRSAS